jgi:hypothetical protein
MTLQLVGTALKLHSEDNVMKTALQIIDQHNGAQTRYCLDEPSIGEMLSDPIVRAMMDADGVEPGHLAAMLGKLRWK